MGLLFTWFKFVVVHCCPPGYMLLIHRLNGELNEDMMATPSPMHFKVLKHGTNHCQFLRLQYCFWFTVLTWGWGRVVLVVRSFCLFLWLLLLHRSRKQCGSLAITKYGHSNYIYWEPKEMITVWVSGHEQSTVSWTWTKILVITCCPCTSYSNWRTRMTKFRLVSENKCRLKSSVQ